MLNDAMSFLISIGAMEAITGLIMVTLAIAVFNFFFNRR
jgi:hypothetical protein